MNSSIHNQKGITLVETLAAVVIVSFLTVIIWRFFFQTIDYNSYAVSEQTLQQEANVILATLQAEHTRNTIYILYIKNGGVYAKTGDSCTDTLISYRPGITYTLPESASLPLSLPCSFPVEGVASSTAGNNRINMDVSIGLSSTYKDGQLVNYKLNTRLSKLTAN